MINEILFRTTLDYILFATFNLVLCWLCMPALIDLQTFTFSNKKAKVTTNEILLRSTLVSILFATLVLLDCLSDLWIDKKTAKVTTNKTLLRSGLCLVLFATLVLCWLSMRPWIASLTFVWTINSKKDDIQTSTVVHPSFYFVCYISVVLAMLATKDCFPDLCKDNKQQKWRQPNIYRGPP